MSSRAVSYWSTTCITTSALFLACWEYLFYDTALLGLKGDFWKAYFALARLSGRFEVLLLDRKLDLALLAEFPETAEL